MVASYLSLVHKLLRAPDKLLDVDIIFMLCDAETASSFQVSGGYCCFSVVVLICCCHFFCFVLLMNLFLNQSSFLSYCVCVCIQTQIFLLL